MKSSVLKPGVASPNWPERPRHRRVSVVIPVLNESARIASVVRLARASRLVGEVLVIDDGSIDGTPELAREAGARVITSTLLGKGASLDDGMAAARYDTVLYLDGDLSGLEPRIVGQMTRPILDGKADFVKARFARRAGRVTILTARPLIQTYFPELNSFAQPLGGIMAARRDLLRQLRFENDYGVDIGLLIDASAMGARLLEVDIGRIEHQSQDLDRLGEMATQVARAILDRAAAWGRLTLRATRAARERDRQRRAHPEHVVARIGAIDRLALFDMGGTVLAGSFVRELAQRTGRLEKVAPLLQRFDLAPAIQARRVARQFRGVKRHVFETLARELPLNPGAVEAVVGLRKLGYRVGIISDSYHIAADIIRRRVFADFALANILEFHGDRATGEVTLSPTMRADRPGRLAYDKLNALRFLCRRMGIPARAVVSVGDGDNDTGMLRASGLSFAFRPQSDRVRRAASHVLSERLDTLLRWIKPLPEAGSGA